VLNGAEVTKRFMAKPAHIRGEVRGWFRSMDRAATAGEAMSAGWHLAMHRTKRL